MLAPTIVGSDAQERAGHPQRAMSRRVMTQPLPLVSPALGGAQPRSTHDGCLTMTGRDERAPRGVGGYLPSVAAERHGSQGWVRRSSKTRVGPRNPFSSSSRPRCIGCGCLSLRTCRLINTDDVAATDGPGSYLLEDRGSRRQSARGAEAVNRPPWDGLQLDDDLDCHGTPPAGTPIRPSSGDAGRRW
jgi:hypothetical protein